MKSLTILLIFTASLIQASFAQTDSVLTIKPLHEAKKHRFLSDSRNSIKFNLLSPFYSNLSVASQHMIDDEKSFQITASYMDFGGIFGGSDESYDKDNQATKMVSFAPEFRYNLNGKYLSGVYFGAFFRYYFMNYTYDSIDRGSYYYSSPINVIPKSYTYQVLGIGLVFGSQTIYKRKILLDTFIGPIYNIMLASSQTIKSNSDLQVHDDIPNLFLRGYGIRAGIFVGLAY